MHNNIFETYDYIQSFYKLKIILQKLTKIRKLVKQIEYY
jgi:hypothetical protein